MALGGRNIQGITIEIDGDTSKLGKALKDVNSSLKTTGTELKDINKLLKLDPTNTTLLTQKQQALEKQIGNVKTKLDTLKTAQSQMDAKGVDKNSQQYQALQREIISCEQELNKYIKEQQNVKWAGWDDMAKKIGNVGEKLKGVGTTLSTAVTLPLVAVGTAGVKSFAEVDKTMQLTNKTMGNTEAEAKLLNKAMKDAAANSTFGMNDAATATLNFARAGLNAEQAAAALAPSMNLAAGEGGNLDTVSAGLVATINGFHGSFDDASKYADVFAAACNNSALDVDSLSDAMSVAAPIFSSAGYSINDAALYMGVMANNGIEANKAANSLKTGIARLVSPSKEGATAMDKLHISITDTDGAMKDSTQVQKELHDAFGKLSEAEQIAAASAIFGKNQMAPWLALINTAPEDVQNLNDSLTGCGKSFSDWTTKMNESGHSVSDMEERLGKLGISSDAVKSAFNNSGGEAVQFAANLWEAADAGVSMEDVCDALGISMEDLQGVMDNTVGVTDEMADAMMSGFGGSIEKLKSSLDVLVTSLGEALAPTIQKVVTCVQNLVDKFNSLTPEQQQTIAKIGLMVAAIGPLLVVLGTLMTSVSSVMGGISGLGKAIGTFISQTQAGTGIIAKFGTAISGISAPMLAIVAVIGVLVAAFVHLWNTNEDFRKKIIGIWDGVKKKWDEVTGKITEAIKKLGFDFGSLSDAIKAAWDWLCNMLAPILAGVFAGIAATVEGFISIVGGVITTIVGIIQGFKDGDWSTFLEGLKMLWDGLWSIVTAPVKAVFETITGFIEMAGTSWGKIWDSVKGFFIGVWDAIKKFFSEVWTSMCNNASKAVSDVTNAVTGAWDKVTGIFKKVWDAIKKFFGDVWASITGTAKDAVDKAASSISDGWNKAKEATSKVFNAVKDFLKQTWDNIKNNVASTVDGIKEKITAVWNNIKDTVSTVVTGIKDKLTQTWDAAKNAIGTTVDNIRTKVGDTWNNIKSNVSTTVDTLKTGVTQKWDAMKASLSTNADTTKQKLSTAWDSTKTKISSVAESLTSAVNKKMSSMKDKVTNLTNTLKTSISNAWNTIKTNLTSKVDSIKSAMSSKWSSIKDNVSTNISRMKSTISSGVQSMYSTVTNTFTNIGNSIKTKINAAKDAVHTAIEAIKNKFRFSWSLPRLSLPHVSISGHFSLNPPSVPHFSISWYKKAMENGMILNSPTIFGMKGNTLLGGGEAGAEAVIGLHSLVDHINNAVNSAITNRGISGNRTAQFGNFTFNIYASEGQDVEELAEQIGDVFRDQIAREGLVWA